MNRRGFLGGIISAIAAPAIVKPFNIMPIRLFQPIDRNNLLTIRQITIEAIRLFENSDAFIQNINHQYNEQFEKQFIVGSQLKIKLPTDYYRIAA